MNTKELIDRFFKELGVKFELAVLENLGNPSHDIILIYPMTQYSVSCLCGKDNGWSRAI